jgi:hypothetical protein
LIMWRAAISVYSRNKNRVWFAHLSMKVSGKKNREVDFWGKFPKYPTYICVSLELFSSSPVFSIILWYN